tara:strand:- start:281 stop:706 length:426 start_codon:yes stop_codon:yes gene_type:complete
MTDVLRPFHLAIPVTDIQVANNFYTDVLGCSVGRKANKWIDFNFFGHQVTAHKITDASIASKTNYVDGADVPSRHFGIILNIPDWKKLIKRIEKKKIKFLIPPQIRFKGKIGEQSTFFILDPFGNALEFKAFQDDSQIYSP